MNPQIQNVFRKRKITYTIVFVVILGVYFFASAITQFHLQEACRIPESISLDRSESDTGCTGDSAVSENHGQADRNSAAFCGGNGNCRCVCICADPVRFRVHRPQLHHETHRANHCCLFPECSRCGLGNASDVFLWAEHPDRIFRPVLYHIRNADPCVYRNH